MMDDGVPSIAPEFRKHDINDSLVMEVHWPAAHARPLDPQLFPLGEKTSAGQADEFPVHTSAASQLASFAGRQTWVAGANRHCAVQQGALLGSQTAFGRNLQVLGSQHVEFEPLPGSQSSPLSTIPLPHICSVIV